MVRSQEAFNFYSHLAGMIAAAIGMLFLCGQAWGRYVGFRAWRTGLGMVLLVPLVLIAMARIEEIAAVAFGKAPRRLITKSAALAPASRKSSDASLVRRL